MAIQPFHFYAFVSQTATGNILPIIPDQVKQFFQKKKTFL